MVDEALRADVIDSPSEPVDQRVAALREEVVIVHRAIPVDGARVGQNRPRMMPSGSVLEVRAVAGRYGHASAMIERAHGYRAPMSADASTRSFVYQAIPSMRPASIAASARVRASVNGRTEVTPQAANPRRRASARAPP